MKGRAIANYGGSDSCNRWARCGRAIGIKEIRRRINLNTGFIRSASWISSCDPNRGIRQQQCHGMIKPRHSIRARGRHGICCRIVKVGIQAGGADIFVVERTANGENFAVGQESWRSSQCAARTSPDHWSKQEWRTERSMISVVAWRDCLHQKSSPSVRIICRRQRQEAPKNHTFGFLHNWWWRVRWTKCSSRDQKSGIASLIRNKKPYRLAKDACADRVAGSKVR